MQLSECAKRIQPSATLAISAQCARLKQQGLDVINFSAGEPDFDTPQHIIDAAMHAAQSGLTRYTPVAGTISLRETIQQRIISDLGLDYDIKEIIVSSGAKQSCALAMQAVLNADDEVIIPAPYWVSYPEMAQMIQAKPVIITTSEAESWRITPEQLKQAITPKTRMLILNSPSNPTGVVYSTAELMALAEVLLAHPDIYILSDDIYEKIYWHDQPFQNIAMVCPELKSRTLVVNGTSKAYAMTGWRIGYTAGPQAVIAAMSRLQSHGSGCACSISQAAAEAAFASDQSDVKKMLPAYIERAKITQTQIKKMQHFKSTQTQGAFYTLIDSRDFMQHKALADCSQLAEYLLHEAHLAVVPGIVFGMPGHFRLSFALATEQLEKGLARLATLDQT